MDIIKVAVLAVTGVLLALILKQTKPEYSVFLSMAVCILIFLYLLSRLQTVLGYVQQLEGVGNIDGV